MHVGLLNAFIPPSPTTFGAGGILFSDVFVRGSLHPENIVNTISQKSMKQMSPDLITDVFGFIDVLIRFCVQQFKGQGHNRQ